MTFWEQEKEHCEKEDGKKQMGGVVGAGMEGAESIGDRIDIKDIKKTRLGKRRGM